MPLNLLSDSLALMSLLNIASPGSRCICTQGPWESVSLDKALASLQASEEALDQALPFPQCIFRLTGGSRRKTGPSGGYRQGWQGDIDWEHGHMSFLSECQLRANCGPGALRFHVSRAVA